MFNNSLLLSFFLLFFIDLIKDVIKGSQVVMRAYCTLLGSDIFSSLSNHFEVTNLFSHQRDSLK